MEILKYPDPRLRAKAEPVLQVNSEIQTIIDQMFDTMYRRNGCGLAATQVGIMKRILIYDGSDDQSAPGCLINPEIVHVEGIRTHTEGCLSFPGIFLDIKRAKKIHVKALNRKGQPIELVHENDLPCAIIQHESDHLDGKLFIDYISSVKRHLMMKKLKKISREK